MHFDDMDLKSTYGMSLRPRGHTQNLRHSIALQTYIRKRRVLAGSVQTDRADAEIRHTTRLQKHLGQAVQPLSKIFGFRALGYQNPHVEKP